MSKFKRLASSPSITMSAVAHRGGNTVVEKVNGMFRGSQFGMPPYDPGTPPEDTDLLHRLENTKDDEVWEWLQDNWDEEKEGLFIEYVIRYAEENGAGDPEVIYETLKGASPGNAPEWLTPAVDFAKDKVIEMFRPEYDDYVTHNPDYGMDGP